MDIEHHHPTQLHLTTAAAGSAVAAASAEHTKPKSLMLLILNIILLLIGGCGNPLILRVYFLHGDGRKWFTSFLQTAGFPLLLLPLLFSFLRSPRRSFFLISPFLLLCSFFIGLLNGINNLLYSYGISYLPVSTSSLLISTQLGFTAVFAFFIVKQKFTASSINAVVLQTFGAVVLGVHSNGDRPEGESMAKYHIGFIMMLAVAVMSGLMLPLLELMYAKSKMKIGYNLVMEIQVVSGFAATAICAVGMAVNKDFQAISREGHLYDLGETKYYVVIIVTTIITQCLCLGLIGTVKYSSALLSGIIISLCLPITEVLAVFLFHEKFDGEKGVAVALSLWGTASYFYGEYRSYQQSKAVAMKDKLPVSLSDSGSIAVHNQ